MDLMKAFAGRADWPRGLPAGAHGFQHPQRTQDW